MSKFIVRGGKPLSGKVQIGGSKNAVLPLLAASLLVEETKLTNVPRILDVDRMLDIIKFLGGDFEWLGEHELRITTTNLKPQPLPEAARKLRASILFAGPLLARFGEAILPYPGGDIIGARPIADHIDAFVTLGAEVVEGENLEVRAEKLYGGKIVMGDPSVTATENILMVAAGIEEDVEIRLAAAEPHVQDLCLFLQQAGVKIEGVGTPMLRVHGTSKRRDVEHEVIPDELEISGFACLAAATHSHVTLAPVKFDVLDSVLQQLRDMGVNYEVHPNFLEILPPTTPYKAHRIQSGLYPKLVTDHLPPFAVLATQAEGASLVHDWLYEARQSYIGELFKMGANTLIMDPHRSLIMGPSHLHGTEVTTYDIRAGMALLIAALVAEGPTTILGVEHIDRGYQDIEERLRDIGADITRVD